MKDKSFWQGKKVFVTGHTGFKGAWLSLWLSLLGAEVSGYALEPPTVPSLFELCRIDKLVDSIHGDIRDRSLLIKTIDNANPEIVFHMAAQPLVQESYRNPADTYAVNIMGTVNLFECIRKSKNVKAVIIVTSDKCYLNKEWYWGYRENDSLGGYDPYSNSKACCELITASYRDSFFNPLDYDNHGVGVASVRAGNVVGGGDWARDRLIPDCIMALLKGDKILMRNPSAIRPWQHVLEPLGGYLTLAHKLYDQGADFSEGWNFGPDDNDARTVEWIVRRICEKWGSKAAYEIDKQIQLHEAGCLKLDCSKAKTKLGYSPKWNLETALDKVVEWTKAYRDKEDICELCFKQIKEYLFN